MRAVIVFTMTILLSVAGSVLANDPAPIPDEVIEAVVNRPLAAEQNTLPGAVREHLDATLELLDNYASDSVTDADVSNAQTERTVIGAKRSELASLRAEARRQLADSRRRLISLGLHQHAEALDDLATQVEDRFRRVDDIENAIANAADDATRRAASKQARILLRQLRRDADDSGSTTYAPVPTFDQERPLKPRPQTPARGLPAYAQNAAPGGNMLAFNGDLMLLAAAAPVTPPEAAECDYTAADLLKDSTAQAEVRVTADITELADSLNYSPVKIYKWVYENIEYEPYYGSLKGAQATLLARAGNDTDTASLLIALLRASNIPARYVKGQIDIRDSTAAGADARAANWLGVKTYDAAILRLRHGKNPNADVATNGITKVHVWVEACVPYGHYRGARIDNSGHRWIPLDASFKDKTYQAGIETNVEFDYTAYLAGRRNGPDSLPHEAYGQQILAAIRAQNPNATLDDVPYRGRIKPLRIDVLPASLPYEVSRFLAWDATGSAEAAALPDAHRYKLRINVYNANNTFGTNTGSLLPTTTLQMPEHVLKRITLSPRGATSADQTALNAWRNDGNLSSAVPTTINVIPVIKSDGEDVGVGTVAAKLHGVSNRLLMQILLPELGSGSCTSEPASAACANRVYYSNIRMANYYALQGYAFQASAEHIADRAERLLASVRNTASPNSNLEETEGEFLNVVLLKYMRNITQANALIGQWDWGTGDSGNHLGLSTGRMKVDYLFDLPFAINRTGFVIDVLGGRSRSIGISSGAVDWDTFLLSGYAMSAYESYIWQENSRLDAVSTVTGIQYAKETGIAVLNLTKDTWSVAGDSCAAGHTCCANTSSRCYRLLNNANAELDYSVAEVRSVYNNYIAQGHTVMIPRSLILYGNSAPLWKGSVYIATKNALSTTGDGNARFAIAGIYAGGETVSTPISFAYKPPSAPDAPTNNTGYRSGSTTPTTVNPPGLAPYYVAGQLNFGVNMCTTLSGDPVNMVTGNMYHTEKDISIAGRGGLPIVFERSYNSRMASKAGAPSTPLGFGWTHSFNHYLRFYGVQGTAAKVSWIDGTGNEKFFHTTAHTSGRINTNATLTNPLGIFVTFKRESNGQYTIREKNGMIYTFQNINSGTSDTGVIAKLVNIKDRNLNTLTLAYSNGNLGTVVDGLGRGLRFTYNTGNRITEITEIGFPANWTPRVWQYGYSGAHLANFKNPQAVASPTTQPPVRYTYYTAADGTHRNHAMKSYVLPNGNSMTFEYYANGRVFRHTTSSGEAMTFTYNDYRRETVQVNERGLERHFFFNEWGNPVKIIEENGAERTYTYASAQPYNRLSKTDPLGYKTTYVYDAVGNVTSIKSPRGTTQTFGSFNTYNQPQLVKDERGNYTVLTYNGRGNLTQRIALKAGVTPTIPYTPVATDIVAWTINTYDTYGNLTSTKQVRDPATMAGPITVYAYDADKLSAVSVSREGDLDGDAMLEPAQTMPLTFDAVGRQTLGIDTDWQAVTTTYDSVDRIATGTDGLGNVRNYAYDANGNLIEDRLTIAGAQVDLTTYAYDDSDRRIAETRYGNGSTGAVSTTEYDQRGNPTTITDPDGYSLGFVYDEGDRPLRAFDQEGNEVYTVRDVTGRNQCSVDPNGNVTWYTYWDASRNSRLKRITGPAAGTCPGQPPASGARAVEYDYDANGNIISTTQIASDGSPSRDSFTRYDELNRPVQTEGPLYIDPSLGAIRAVTQTVYNVLGHPTAVLAGHCAAGATGCTAAPVLSPQSTLVYDDFGRKHRETDARDQSWVYTYDGHNNVAQVTDAKGQLTTYDWRYGHQLTRRSNLAAGHVEIDRNALGLPESERTYAAGNASTLLVEYTRSYDALYRPDTVTDRRGNVTLDYDYSPAGRLNKVTDSHGNTTNYLYDAVGRLNGIWAPNYGTVSFRHDPGGRRIEKWTPNGVTTRYSWNADGSLAQVTNRRLASSIMSQHTYQYDGFGNRNQAVDLIAGVSQTRSYTYDALDRLLSVSDGTAANDESYQYDPLNNLTQQTIGTPATATTAFVHDAANQLLETRSDSASGNLLSANVYDANGNLTKRCSGGTVTRTETDCTGTTVTSLTLDSLNRTTQVQKTGIATESYAYDHQGRRIRKVAGATTRNYVYEGDDLYSEYASAYATPVALYVHGPATDDPLLKLTGSQGPNATAQYYHQDGLGSVVGVSNASGSIAFSARYDAWGTRIASTSAYHQYGYTGREPDATGLIYYRARYYDPSQRRFTQRDPIGLAGGINPYAYVNNNPVNFTDPTGNLAFDNAYTNAMDQAACYYGTVNFGGSGSGMTSGSQTLVSNNMSGATYGPGMTTRNQASTSDGSGRNSYRFSGVNHQETMQDRANRLAADITKRGYFTGKGESDWLYQINSDPNLTVTINAPRLSVAIDGEWRRDPRGGSMASGRVTGDDYAVHGQVTVRRRPDNSYGIYDERYDYEMHPGFSPRTILRNTGTLLGSPPAGWPNTPYWIHYQGDVNVQ